MEARPFRLCAGLSLPVHAPRARRFEPDGPVTRIRTTAREVFDVSGAGDTVVAVLTAALAAGASPVESAALANAAGMVVVGKLGTAVARTEEILDALS